MIWIMSQWVYYMIAATTDHDKLFRWSNIKICAGIVFIWWSSIQDEFEDTNGVIRNRKSKKNRQHNDKKKKYKRTNNDQQNIHIKLFIYLLHSFYIAHYLILKLLKALYIKTQITKKQKSIYRIKLFTDKCETLHMNLEKGKAITKSKNSENGVY